MWKYTGCPGRITGGPGRLTGFPGRNKRALFVTHRDEVSFSTLFTFIEYMENETEYVPWRVLFDQTEGLFEALPVYSRAYKYLLVSQINFKPRMATLLEDCLVLNIL